MKIKEGDKEFWSKTHEERFLIVMKATLKPKLQPVEIPKFHELNQVMKFFKDEETCKRILTLIQWPNGVFCPNCGQDLKIPFPGEIICPDCKSYFSYKSETLYNKSKQSLQQWFLFTWLRNQFPEMRNNKIASLCDINYKTAARMRKEIDESEYIQGNINFPVLAGEIKRPVKESPEHSALKARFGSIEAMQKFFSGREHCNKIIKDAIWPDGNARCPYCDYAENREYKNKYLCGNCNKSFTPKTMTFYEHKAASDVILQMTYIYLVYMPGASAWKLSALTKNKNQKLARQLIDFLKTVKNPLSSPTFPVITKKINVNKKRIGRYPKVSAKEKRLNKEFAKIYRQIGIKTR